MPIGKEHEKGLAVAPLDPGKGSWDDEGHLAQHGSPGHCVKSVPKVEEEETQVGRVPQGGSHDVAAVYCLFGC